MIPAQAGTAQNASTLQEQSRYIFEGTAIVGSASSSTCGGIHSGGAIHRLRLISVLDSDLPHSLVNQSRIEQMIQTGAISLPMCVPHHARGAVSTYLLFPELHDMAVLCSIQ